MDLDESFFENSQINDHFSFIDISVQQRNNKKGWTVISNLKLEEKIIKDFMQKAKRKLSCNGAIDENNNIRFNGDHRESLSELLIKELNISKDRIRVS